MRIMWCCQAAARQGPSAELFWMAPRTIGWRCVATTLLTDVLFPARVIPRAVRLIKLCCSTIFIVLTGIIAA